MKHKRLELIEDYLSSNKRSTVNELSEKFNISIATVRRDLLILEENNIIKKEYGGVRFIENNKSPLIPYTERNVKNKEKKEYIGSLAANQIANNDCIFIDSGTTSHYIIDFLGTKSVTIITNNLYVIEKCTSMPNVQLIVLGGNYNRDVHGFVGEEAINEIKKFNINKAFVATSGFTPDNGFTNAAPSETDFKNYVSQKSQKVYILLDDTKWGKTALKTFLYLEDNSEITIITNSQPVKYANFFKNFNNEIIY